MKKKKVNFLKEEKQFLKKSVGMNDFEIFSLESGTYNPTFKFAQKLAKALETDLTITFSK